MKSEMVRARVSAEEMAAYRHVAGREPLSAWVRRMLNDAAATGGRTVPIGVIETHIGEAKREAEKTKLWTPDQPPTANVGHMDAQEPTVLEQMARDAEPEPAPVRRCEQWRNHRAGRFCKTCGETMPV